MPRIGVLLLLVSPPRRGGAGAAARGGGGGGGRAPGWRSTASPGLLGPWLRVLSGNLCAPRRGLGGLGGAGGTAGRERRGASSEHVLTSPAAGPLRAVGVRARRRGDAGWNRHRPFPATLGNEPEAAVAPEAFGRTVSFCNSELGAACVWFALLSRRRKRNCFCLLPEIPLLKTASHGLSVFFFLPAFHFLLGNFLGVHALPREFDLGAGGSVGLSAAVPAPAAHAPWCLHLA